jgi:hypothetical protein
MTFPESGIIKLGPQNKAALGRLASYVSDTIRETPQEPKSVFIEMIVDRITSKVSKLDACMILSGPKGSGKSYSAVGLAYRTSVMLAAKNDGKPEDYFTLKNSCILSDPESINSVLREARENQIILCDDTGITFGNRSFMNEKNQNFNRILAICRTMRWFLIFTVPLRSQVDLQLRQLANYYGVVYKSFHAAKFNILKIYSTDVKETGKNETYSRRLSFDEKKMDFFVCFAPPDHLIKEYDKIRAATAKNIVNSGGSLTTDFVDKKAILINALKREKKPNYSLLAKKYGFCRQTVQSEYKKLQEQRNAVK